MPVWSFHGVQANMDPTGPLVPDLVPPANTTFEVQNRERLDFFESNEYRWAFISISQGFETIPVAQWWATLQGSFLGNLFGARRTEITNNLGQPLFVIEMAKYTWNPTRLSWSFRIRNPLTEEILYTINKDWFGTGFLFLKDEWRIYRGRRRQRDQIYYVVGSYLGYGHRFYHSKNEYRVNLPPCAEASQEAGRSLLALPDVYSLKVHEGEDTALLLATMVIIDMVHDSEAAARQREANERERSQSHSLLQGEEDSMENMWSGYQEGSMAEVWSEEAMAAAEAK